MPPPPRQPASRAFSLIALAGLLAWVDATASQAADYSLPARVQVLPVFLVPTDQAPPTAAEKTRFIQHLTWAQTRYRELLGNRTTFALAANEPAVVAARRPVSQYRAAPENGVPLFVSELLEHYRYNRFNCPYIFATVVMNSTGAFPAGSGRTLNRGWNSGGGVLVVSSWILNNERNFQSTLQHELGHSFGLPHVDVYGYDMSANASLMSYNPAHWTNGLSPSATPGALIPEDIRALLHNRRVFPDLTANPALDLPAGYRLAEPVWLGAMSIPGQLDYLVQASTTHPGLSPPGAMLLNQIKPSAGPGITFDGDNMWHSGPSADGWVQVEITFPLPVTLDRVTVHSQHSGLHWMAEKIRVEPMIGGSFREIANAPLAWPDETVEFSAATAQVWRFWFFNAGGQVALRGLEFFFGHEALFPPQFPTFYQRPAVMAAPASQTVSQGGTVTFSVQAAGTLPLRYQWQKDGAAIAGATNAIHTIDLVQPGDAGTYTVVVANVAGSITSAAALLEPVPLPARLINLSILAELATPDDTLSLGTVIGGAGTRGVKPMLVRAAGPSLSALGVSGVHPDPRLEWFGEGAARIGENDNWAGTATLAVAFAQLGAFPYAGPNSRDAAIFNAAVALGNTSVRVGGVGDATGSVLAELYDATPAAAFTPTTPRLINVSVLKQIGGGLTVGFVLGAGVKRSVLIRAVGPGLAGVGVQGVSLDPKLTLFAATARMDENDNWAGASVLAEATARVGAFAIPPASNDAVLLAALEPGAYSVQVTGPTGLVLVEVYEVP